jgi:hypothetical protein
MPLIKRDKPEPVDPSQGVRGVPQIPKITAEPTVVSSIEGWSIYNFFRKFHPSFRKKRKQEGKVMK